MKSILLSALIACTAIHANAQERVIMNNTLVLPGYLATTSAPIRRYFSFDNNDVVKFDLIHNAKAGTDKIEVYSYPDNQIVYSKDDIKSYADSFMISKKGIYYLTVMTNHISEKNVTLKVIRKASASSKKDFSTNVVTKSDTTFQQVSSDNYTINTARYTVPVNVPPNTRYWVYWVGIGDEPIIKYETYTEFYRMGKSGPLSNPLYAYGKGVLSELPATNYKHSMDYKFADHSNAQMFLSGLAYKYFPFKSGNGISADYAKVEGSPGQMRMLIQVPTQSVGAKLKLIVGAFLVNETYVMETP